MRYDITIYLGKETYQFYEQQAKSLNIPLRSYLAMALQMSVGINQALTSEILKGCENNDKNEKL